MNILLIVLAIAAFDLLVVVAILKFGISGIWKPLHRICPSQPMEKECVCRDYQTFKFDMIAIGLGVHACVDDTYLHLELSKWLNWIRLPRISIPFDQMEILPPSKLLNFQKLQKIKIGRHVIEGPAWCFELARSITPSSDM